MDTRHALIIVFSGVVGCGAPFTLAEDGSGTGTGATSSASSSAGGGWGGEGAGSSVVGSGSSSSGAAGGGSPSSSGATGGWGAGGTGGTGPTGPVVVATGAFMPAALRLGGASVYWSATGAGSGVWMAPVNGGNPSHLAVESVNCYGLALDSGFVWWTTIAGAVERAPVGGGPAESIYPGAAQNLGLVAGGGNLFWVHATPPSGVIVQGTTQGSVSKQFMSIMSLGVGQQGIVLSPSSDRVYWVDGASVRMRFVSGGASVTIGGSSKPAGLAADANSVYWTDAIDGAVLSVPASGGQASVVAAGETGPAAVTIVGPSLYWLTTDGASYSLVRAGADGSNRTVLASGAGKVSISPYAMAADSSRLYWGTVLGSSGTVWRIDI